MCGNSENSAAVSDNSLTMAENWFLGALIVTSTMPLESEILASLRTLDASGLLLLDSVSENLLFGFWDAGAVSVNCQMLLPLQYLCVMDRGSEIKVLYASNKCYYTAIKCSRKKQQCKPI